MAANYHKIRNTIQEALCLGKKDFIIYPYGENGVLTKQILNDSFGIKESYVVDNVLSKFNSNIKNLEFCNKLDKEKYIVLFTCANVELYREVRGNLRKYFPDDSVIEIFENKFEEKQLTKNVGGHAQKTLCGKYSYGTLCNHWLVESVGAFCSFAAGVDVVENHPIMYVSTHPFLYCGGKKDTIHESIWEDWKQRSECFAGVEPQGENYKLERITIGNDVWLGRNVIITNSSRIGNGVIAGAGAVITKDIPDYAIVAGVPARIIRYRYTKEQIEALNRIAWWNWSDEKIRKYYEDFYMDIRTFIQKHDV
ncbi:MAG: CatB-related O-acetyltransferase [Lachnospiraceae bacterium]|nr:CatB-related O-acetyltransferase [Lachnospiraceae bacterium]